MARNLNLGCACCPVNRRQFLVAGCATCAGAAIARTATPAQAGEAKKIRIRIIYALFDMEQTRPTWPHAGFDFGPVVQRITAELTHRCPGFEFVTATAAEPQEAQKILEADKSAPVDGYLVCQMNNWCTAIRAVAASGKPVLYADCQYCGSGGFLCYGAGLLRKKLPNVGFVASSRIEDLAVAVQCFALVARGGSVADFVAATTRLRIERTAKPGDPTIKPDAVRTISARECVERLKRSKILAFRDDKADQGPSLLGVPVVYLPFSELNAAWESADKDQADAIADRWQKSAAKIQAVNRATLRSSAAMYLAQKTLLKKHAANAVTINCLGGFYGKHIHAYPCLGFHELNNEGLIGGCECDLRSAATMVAMTTLTQGRPGFISDPVLDTAKRQIIYAHCVASTRPFGPQGGSVPFEILTHSEDRQGAAVRAYLPLDYMTTTVEFDSGKKEVLFHQGKAVENVVEDKACRTKLAVEPLGDFEKLFTEWDRWNWHRVTCYGDLKEPVFALADAFGYKVTTET